MKKSYYVIFCIVLSIAVIAQCFIISDMEKKRFTKARVLYLMQQSHVSGYYNCLKGDTIYDENRWHQDSTYFVQKLMKK